MVFIDLCFVQHLWSFVMPFGSVCRFNQTPTTNSGSFCKEKSYAKKSSCTRILDSFAFECGGGSGHHPRTYPHTSSDSWKPSKFRRSVSNTCHFVCVGFQSANLKQSKPNGSSLSVSFLASNACCANKLKTYVFHAIDTRGQSSRIIVNEKVATPPPISMQYGNHLSLDLLAANELMRSKSKMPRNWNDYYYYSQLSWTWMTSASWEREEQEKNMKND